MACVTVPAATAEMDRAFALLPGFRFHPTDQELVTWFLKRKLLGLPIDFDFDFIPEVDVYKFEPDQLPDKSFSPSTGDPGAKVEWYFFAPRARKYPTGLRMARATVKGFWKSTGKDRPIIHNGIVVGMKKTLVFHLGRVPDGMRTDWVMHEYRLHPDHRIHDTYTLCRVFNKSITTPSPDLLAGADMDKEGIQLVSVGPNMNKDEMQTMLRGVNAGKKGVHSMLNDADLDKEGIQPMSDGPNANMEGNQPVFHNANSDKEEINHASGSVVVDMEGIHPMSGGFIADVEGIHPVFGHVVPHNKETDPMSGGVYAGVDFSWMQFVPADICYPNIELDKDDSCTQLINDYSW
ncbi:NAC domain containing protein 50-like [Triticum dicoccoides]|uniref:NAC domain containing protein 50-like n=1 Tax=Triticum dicoccoides TaxID=85692 RepID=UPI00188E691D|nr:NAC domain containing protein 50-like [Triticum dicoccoides]XP_037471327.1 NAC domain containing protein 50-like [Triticum dicoccoides]